MIVSHSWGNQKHRYPSKNILLAVFLKFSIPKVGQTCLKPSRRSLLSEQLTMKAFCSPSCSLVHERKLPALANQNSRKNRQKGLTDKKSDIFLQKSDVTEHD